MSAELVLVVVGAALVVAALTWWVLSRRRQREVLARALRSPDDETRRSATELVVEQGLADRYAATLATAAANDPVVRDALLASFRAAPWQAAVGPDATRLQLQVERGVPAAEVPPDLLREGQPPILITGVGGAAGVAVLLALRSRRRIIGVDADPFAVGLQLADEGVVLPRGDAPEFVPALVALAQRTGARSIICTVAEEMVALHDGSAALDAAGLRTWIAPRAAVVDCVDKWRFAQRCETAGLPVPRTALGEQGDVPGPWVVKPRFGRGSRDIVLASTPDEVAAALKRVPDPIVQTMLEGQEFTVDVLVDTDGVPACVVPRWRLETKGGISTKGRTFSDADLEADVARLVAEFDLAGAINVQGFVGADGRAQFTEINPRFSGGLPLSIAAGADLAGEYLHRLEGGEFRMERLTARAGVTMARYFSEVYTS